MSAIFGEKLTFGQRMGGDVCLVVHGDEFYSRHETEDGYTVVYDEQRGLFCYAVRVSGALVSSGIAITAGPPAVERHLQEAPELRRAKRQRRKTAIRPRSSRASRESISSFTSGPNGGLLEGRQLTSGKVKGLTILVNFQDVTSTVAKSDVHDLLNGQNYTRNGNFCSARDYFKLVSNGKLDYSNDVVGPFTLSHNREYYVTQLLVEEALDLAVASGVKLRDYDSKGQNLVDALNIMYAGQTQYLGDLWPHNAEINLTRGGVRTELYLLTSMGRSADELTIGTFCHENGHLLCRFPDMYDYGERDGDTSESAGIGVYCLMGSGNHLNNGRTPSPVCSYLRELVGWCNPISLTEPGDYEAKHADYGTVLKMPTANGNEYFIIENRSKLGLDQYLPSSGLAVYHCDIFGSNELQEGSATRHYQCALLQADGHLDLEHNLNQGDGADLFALVTGTALSSATLPHSRCWDGSDSGLMLSGITAPAATIRFVAGPAAPANVAHGEAAPALDIPDETPAGVASKIAIAPAGIARRIKVGVDIAHTYIGDLIIELTNPGGTTIKLHDRAGGATHNLITTYESSTTATLATMINQPIAGEWTLRVRDVAVQDVGKLNRWTLEIEVGEGPRHVHAEIAPKLAIPDNDPTGISSFIRMTEPGTIKQTKIGIDITHTFIGDLRVELVSPSGRSAILHSRLGGAKDDLVMTYDSASPLSELSKLVGQPLAGPWVLRVTDLAGRDVGTLNKWSIDAITA